MHRSKKYKAFTLSELMIGMLVLGIIAVLTVPNLNDAVRWGGYHTGVMRAKSTLDQVAMKYASENGGQAECGYWMKNPYGGGAECKGYDKHGNCTGWWFKESHDNLPPDYNGKFADCRDIYKFMVENMNVIKVCDSYALAQGCITDIEGIDTIYKNKNENASSYDANKATAGISGFRKRSIHNGKAFITADGMVFIPYADFWAPIMLVDVNGHKKPNKWGHDIHGFIGQIRDSKASTAFFPYINSTAFVEQGGRTTFHVLYKKTR